MRLAAADVLPFRFGSYASSLREHLQKIQRQVIRQNRKVSVAGTESESVEMVADFGPVVTAIERFGDAGVELDRAIDELIARQDSATAAAINDPLMLLERSFLSEDGLPGRPWFRHLLYAPGLTTGYGAWPFPELAEAVENEDPELFARGVERVVGVLDQAVRELQEARRVALGQSD
jgi:N-acetylated-alpha-linked acidic dipeptidase